jgi:hypothetical protein
LILFPSEQIFKYDFLFVIIFFWHLECNFKTEKYGKKVF